MLELNGSLALILKVKILQIVGEYKDSYLYEHVFFWGVSRVLINRVLCRECPMCKQSPDLGKD